MLVLYVITIIKGILNMNNYLSKELNIVKNDKTIETYLQFIIIISVYLMTKY